MNFFIEIIFYNSCIFFCFVNKIVFYYQHHSFNRKQFFFQEKTQKNQDDLKRKEKEIAYFQEKNTTKHFSMRSIILQAKFIMIMKVNFN
jgi:hypothetical protein